jgi:hypothetical protein
MKINKQEILESYFCIIESSDVLAGISKKLENGSMLKKKVLDKYDTGEEEVEMDVNDFSNFIRGHIEENRGLLEFAKHTDGELDETSKKHEERINALEEHYNHSMKNYDTDPDNHYNKLAHMFIRSYEDSLSNQNDPENHYSFDWTGIKVGTK